MSNIIEHDEFVNEYELTRNEYCLMPSEMRLTYADMRFRYIVEEAKKKEVKAGRGYIPLAYEEYFKACGCTLNNFDCGIQEFEVKSVLDVDFTSTEENRQLVAEYVRAIAEVRWQFYASFVEKALFEQLTNLRMGIVDTGFSIEGARLDAVLEDDAPFIINHERAKELVEKQLDAFIKSQESIEINRHINNMYLDELAKRGYTFENTASGVIARILK